jgi:peptidoglycan/LPS O-acetylase OafA/YrhL
LRSWIYFWREKQPAQLDSPTAQGMQTIAILNREQRKAVPLAFVFHSNTGCGFSSRDGMKLRRITTHGNWIPEIDGLRFVAIVATLLTHIFGETYLRSGTPFAAQSHYNFFSLVERGGRGVLLFFAISGFILAQPFLREHLKHGQAVSVGAFFKRRLTRLEPPYILSLLLYAVAQMFYHRPIHTLVLPLLAHMFYVHNFFSLPSLNLATWSLEVEIQFYLLAPVLGYLYAISSPIVRRGAMVALIVGSAVFQHHTHGVISWSLPGQLQYFLVGFLLADLRATRTESQTGRWWDLVSLAVWVAIFAIPVQMTYLLLPLLILIAYLATFNGPITRQIFRTEWIALTGGMCYSFYLMHMLVISIAFKLTRRLIIPSNLLASYLIQVVLLGSCITVVGIAYFVLIERPCMDPNWPHKLRARFIELSRSRKAELAETSVENS